MSRAPLRIRWVRGRHPPHVAKCGALSWGPIDGSNCLTLRPQDN